MSLNKLTCPECSTVMRPKSPVAPGKKVKCPKCSTVFVAKGDADEVEELDEIEAETPRQKASAKKKPKEAPKPAAKKKDDDAETYGYLKDEGEGEEDDEEDGKPKINYGGDDSIRDLRGPAIVLLRVPTNWLTFSGLLGAVGWLAFVVIIIIPFAFPIPPDEVKSNLRGKEAEEKKTADQKAASKRHPFLKVWEWIDFTDVVALQPAAFWASAFGFLALGFYSGLIAFGGIKLINLESRAWGMAASIMAMLPVSALGLAWVFAFAFGWAVRQIEIDEESITYVCIGVAVILWLCSAGLGTWALITANNSTVIEGFEYKPE